MKTLYRQLSKQLDSIRELVILYVSTTLLASISFALFEGRNLWDSLWWSVVTGLTIGYGDIYPTTIGGRITTFALCATVSLFIIPLLIANIIVNMVHDKNAFTDSEQREMMRILRNLEKSK